MVVALFFLTAAVLIAVNYYLRKEDRVMEKTDKSKKSPIFLSPDKALIPLMDSAKRLYHLSHSWVQESDEDYVYVGYDNFIPYLFSSKVKIQDIPLIGSEIPQGTKIWELQSDARKVTQLAPISGEIVEINPACTMDMALPSSQVEKSWILKMKTKNLNHDSHNLMQTEQALFINTALKEEIYANAQQGDYLNDGGQIDPSFINSMSDEEWMTFVHKYFPYQETL